MNFAEFSFFSKTIKQFFHKSHEYLILILFFVPLYSHGLELFTNYAATNQIKDFAISNNTVYVATSGGLVKLDRSNGSIQLLSDVKRFPDLNMTALAFDSKNNLWIGTTSGRLYRLSPDGTSTIYSPYYVSNWSITDICIIDGMVLVATDKGLGVFDPVRAVSLKNATKFGPFLDPKVISLAHIGDTLYLGCQAGVATLYVSNRKLLSSNFYDQSIWNTNSDKTGIQSFVNMQNHVFPLSTPGCLLNGNGIYTDSNKILSTDFAADSGSILHVSLPIEVQVIISDGNRAWIGTKGNWFYSWDGNSDTTHYTIATSLTFTSTNRVHVARDGSVWAMPTLANPTPWWQRISRFKNGTWGLFPSNDTITGKYGSHFRAFCEETSGNLWFGTYGHGAIHFIPEDSIWNAYTMWGSNLEISGGFTGGGAPIAMAQDSSGYVWFGIDQNDDGCLMCYNPKKTNPTQADIALFFPRSDAKRFMPYPWFIHVDPAKRIFVGERNEGIMIFTHDGNPLRGDSSLTFFSNTFGSIGATSDMVSTPDNHTWIASTKGLFEFNPDSMSLKKTDAISANVSCVEVESNNLLWIGSDKGLIKYNRTLKTTEILTTNDGLVANSINDLSYDKSSGTLWIATLGGISQYNVGHSGTVYSDNKSLSVFPNPLSRKNRIQGIFFEKATPDTKIYLYSSTGVLVNQVFPIKTTEFEWRFQWTPSSRIKPGTYYYLAKKGTSRTTGKILILP